MSFVSAISLDLHPCPYVLLPQRVITNRHLWSICFVSVLCLAFADVILFKLQDRKSVV